MNWCFFLLSFTPSDAEIEKALDFWKTVNPLGTNQRVKSWPLQEFWDPIALGVGLISWSTVDLSWFVGKPGMCSLVKFFL